MNIKELSNEQLAVILRCMRITGIATTLTEREALDEAADRLEVMEELNNVNRNRYITPQF